MSCHGLLAQFGKEARVRRNTFGKKMLKDGGSETLKKIDVVLDNFDVCQPIKSRVPPQAQRERVVDRRDSALFTLQQNLDLFSIGVVFWSVLECV